MSDEIVGLLADWRRLSRWPGGKLLFSWLMGRRARYSGSIRSRVLELEPGRARLTLRDRAEVRNHLNSVHAIALANLGELASGLAMLSALDKNCRGIPVAITVEYHKKARGLLTAEGVANPTPVIEPTDQIATAKISDSEGDLVAEFRATWRLSQRPPD